MNAEEIRNKIQFKTRELPYGVMVSGSIEFSAAYSIGEDIGGKAIGHAKESIKERILRSIYEDQRRELFAAVEELLLASSVFADYDKIGKARERLMKAAKYQKPNQN